MTDDPNTVLSIWRRTRRDLAGMPKRGAINLDAVAVARQALVTSRSAIRHVIGWSPEDHAALKAEMDACERILDEHTGGLS